MSSESNKNLKASVYTTLVLILLGLLFFFVSWTPPVHEAPKEVENIDVELGDAPEGSGSQSTGQATAEQTPPSTTENISTPSIEKAIETNNADKEAPAVISKPKVEVKKVVPTVEAPPPTPKYLYKGEGRREEPAQIGRAHV